MMGMDAYLVGPSGSGKTMMARRLPSIIPPMSMDEALDATKLYSVAGMLSCPCGYYGDVYRQCSCNNTQVQKSQKRISGPLLDRKLWGM